MGNLRHRRLLALLGLCGALVSGLAGAARVTTTLLPTHGSGDLWIKTATATVSLSFLLDSLPYGMQRDQLLGCTLRVTAKDVGNPKGGPSGENVVLTADQPDQKTKTVALLLVPGGPGPGPEKRPFRKAEDSGANIADDKLCDAVWDHYSGGHTLKLELATDSRNAYLQLYSNQEATPASFKPRLVLEYERPAPGFWDSLAWHQHQHDPQHSARGRWKPHRPPSGFTLTKHDLPKITGKLGNLEGYPLVWRGRVIVVRKVDDANWLSEFNTKGTELARMRIIDGTLQTTLVISPDGVLTVITETALASYDLKDAPRRGIGGTFKDRKIPIQDVNSLCKLIAKTRLTVADDGSLHKLDANNSPSVADETSRCKLDVTTSLTVADDGSLYLTIKDGTNIRNLLAFDAGLNLFLATELGGEQASTPGLDQAGRVVAVGSSNQAVHIDLTNPARVRGIALQGGPASDEFYPPVAGADEGQIAHADYKKDDASAGALWLVKEEKKEATHVSGKARPSTPVLGTDGRLRYLQDGELRTVGFDDGKPRTLATGLPRPSSNLVLDALDNLFYWSSGRLLGFDAQGKILFDKKFAGGPQQNIRLTLDPWGTLWTSNKNGTHLFAFHPQYDPEDLSISEDLEDRTVYRATNTLRLRKAALKKGEAVLLQAGKAIAFGPGVQIERGATLLAGTGH